MNRILIILILLSLVIFPVNSATLHGTIYSWKSFEPLKNCIVTLNSTPIQKIVAVNGSYSFTVSPGKYKIEVICYNYPNLYATELVEINKNGTFRLDILAQPSLEELNVSVPEINFSIDEGVKEKPNQKPEMSGWDLPYILIPSLLILIAGIASLMYILKKREKSEITEEILPEDLNEIIEIIRKEGGRITQKELRKRTGYSDAKISLMIADLEKRGIVEKVKKGRGNIIFLKD